MFKRFFSRCFGFDFVLFFFHYFFLVFTIRLCLFAMHESVWMYWQVIVTERQKNLFERAEKKGKEKEAETLWNFINATISTLIGTSEINQNIV